MMLADNTPLKYNRSDRQTDRQTDSDSPLLSVIIPVYNVAPYLAKCLASLEGQPYPEEMEFIVIDDGSTDGCAETLDEAARRDGRYRVFHQENQGVSMARNAGLSHVRGKYIAWVDPDDWIAPDWYEKQRSYLLDDVDMIIFDAFTVQGASLQPLQWRDNTCSISRDELFQDLAIDRLGSQLWSKTIKTKLWSKPDCRFSSDISMWEDFSVLHHVIIDANKIEYIHDSLYFYVQCDGSISHVSNSDAMDVLWNCIVLADDRIDFFRSRGIDVADNRARLSELNYVWAFYNPDIPKLEKHYIYILQVKKRLYSHINKVILSSEYPIRTRLIGIVLLLHLEKIWYSVLRKLFMLLRR